MTSSIEYKGGKKIKTEDGNTIDLKDMSKYLNTKDKDLDDYANEKNKYINVD